MEAGATAEVVVFDELAAVAARPGKLAAGAEAGPHSGELEERDRLGLDEVVFRDLGLMAPAVTGLLILAAFALAILAVAHTASVSASQAERSGVRRRYVLG